MAVVAACVGCAAEPFQLAPAPPPVRHGDVRDVILRPYPQGYLANRSVGAALAQALREDAGRSGCATVRAVTASGQVLAYAAVCGTNSDSALTRRIADARALLIECLHVLNNWQAPTLAVCADDGGTVLASAAFTLPVAEARAPAVYRRSLCVVRGDPPLVLEISGLFAPEAELLAQNAQSACTFQIQENARLVSR